MLDIVPELRIVDITHDVPAFDVRAGASRWCGRSSTSPKAWCSRSSIPGSAPIGAASRSRSRQGYLVGPDNGLLAPAVAMLGGPQRVVALENPEYQLPAPGADLRGPRHHGAGRRAPRRRASPIDELGRRGRSRVARARARPAAARTTTTARSPARCCGSTASATASSTSRPSSSSSGASSPGGIVGVRIGTDERRARWVAHVRRRQGVRARGDRRLLRHVRAGARSALRRRPS